MAATLHALIIEDRPADAELLVAQLRDSGFEPVWERVEDEAGFLARLNPQLDVVLADYALPQFDAPRALELLKARGLDVPFIVVSGTIGEEQAVECMRQGAADYLLKDRLGRLGPAVERALAERRLRQEKRQAEDQLRATQGLLSALLENMPAHIFVNSVDGRYLLVNRAWERFAKLTAQQAVGRTIADMFSSDEAQRYAGSHRRVLETEAAVERDDTVEVDGVRRHFHVVKFPIRGGDGQVTAVGGISVDVTAHRQAEQALRESEARFHWLAERAPDLIFRYELRPVRGFSYVSPSATAIVGYTPEEHYADPDLGLKPIHPDDRPLIEQLLAGQGTSQPLTLRWRRKDGSWIWTEQHNVVVRDERGEIVAIEGIARDVTERKRAQDEIERLSQFLQVVIDSANVWLDVLDEQADVLIWNRAAEAISGYTREEVVGHGRIWEWLYPDEAYRRAITAKAAAIIERGEEVEDFETVIRTKSGEARTISWHSRNLLGEDGAPIGSVALGRDVTERKRADEALRQYAQRIETLREMDRAILAASSLAAIAEAVARRVRHVIPCELANVLIFDFERVEARLLSQDAAPGHASALPAGYNEPIGDPARSRSMARHHIWHVEEVAPSASASPLLRRVLPEWVRSFASAPLVAEGELVGMLNLCAARPRAFSPEHLEVAREVADLLAVAIQQARLRERLAEHAAELEQRVAQRTAELSEANAELNAFAYTVSHDLRAPLRTMRGFADILLEDFGESLGPEGQGHTRRIAAASQRMDALIQDLLAYSRVSRAELVVRPVSLSVVVAEALAQLEGDLRERRAEVAVEAPLPDALGQSAMLVQVVANLLGNAAKFVAAGSRPRVRVWATSPGEGAARRVRLWVEDNGIGIAPEHQQEIFGVFRRLHSAERYPGTGIGLAIVRKGVERLGGQVGVESEVGRGSRFWVELPAAVQRG